jgi:hypothetical protein
MKWALSNLLKSGSGWLWIGKAREYCGGIHSWSAFYTAVFVQPTPRPSSMVSIKWELWMEWSSTTTTTGWAWTNKQGKELANYYTCQQWSFPFASVRLIIAADQQHQPWTKSRIIGDKMPANGHISSTCLF